MTVNQIISVILTLLWSPTSPEGNCIYFRCVAITYFTLRIAFSFSVYSLNTNILNSVTIKEHKGIECH